MKYPLHDRQEKENKNLEFCVIVCWILENVRWTMNPKQHTPSPTLHA